MAIANPRRKTVSSKQPKLLLEQVREGACKLFVPAGYAQDPFHKLAFYNLAMSLNRTISARFIQAALEQNQKEELVIDGLCATGARGIRYALEAGCSKVLFVDANEHAIKLVKKNLAANGLKQPHSFQCRDLNTAVYSAGESGLGPARVIEVDAFGTPAPFLQSAIQEVVDGGIVSITATDFAKLAGARIPACVRHYDAVPMHVTAGHEIGLRILIGKMARTAAMLDRRIKPLFSFYLQHAGKVIARVEDSAAGADSDISQNMGFAWICDKCLQSGTAANRNGLNESCTACGSRIDWGGPLWIGRLSDGEFLRKAIDINEESEFAETDKPNAQKLMQTALEENDLPPLFYDVHDFTRMLRLPAPTLQYIESGLAESGFVWSRTHFTPTGLKTNAPAKAFAGIIREGAPKR